MSSITVNRRVLQKLIPIAIGYLALGIACGILAQQAGLTPLEALGMSVLVFAGSGQFIGIAMMAQGAALVSIGLTIFIVNLRHLLFSSTLMNFFNGRSKNFLIGYAHGITDETFAVNLNAFETETDPRWTCEPWGSTSPPAPSGRSAMPSAAMPPLISTRLPSWSPIC